MGIDVHLTTNMGAPIAEPLGDPSSALTRVLRRAPRDSHCLQFIDPYGDTVFNRLQVGTLVAELEALRDNVPEPDLHEHLDSVIAQIGTIRDRVHEYVRFVGD